MIVKERHFPKKLLALEALLRRLSPSHPSQTFIKENYAKTLAGYKGECALDYPLSQIDNKNTFILHDIRLQIDSHYFQIDTLLITPNFILLLEVKNIAGEIIFDSEFEQLIRIYQGVKTAFPYPLNQVKRHQRLLAQWLSSNKLPICPILSFVIISSPYTIIDASSERKRLSTIIMHPQSLPEKITGIYKRYPNQMLPQNEMKKIVKRIIKQNEPIEPKLMEDYKLNREDLITGVICPVCSFSLFNRVHGNWLCPSCGLKDKFAHKTALADYELLFGNTINNEEFRKFLNLSSPYTANRLLRSMNLSNKGVSSDKRYYLNE
ncbi:nuclease-related domain-containing protein [Falsibacillus pallidus]|uniref:nuclease-related domain-containing protein n=1 Tax=Falsibacillus pallidus TaxID=493781 RepID=UPI003D97F70E